MIKSNLRLFVLFFLDEMPSQENNVMFIIMKLVIRVIFFFIDFDL